MRPLSWEGHDGGRFGGSFTALGRVVDLFPDEPIVPLAPHAGSKPGGGRLFIMDTSGIDPELISYPLSGGKRSLPRCFKRLSLVKPGNGGLVGDHFDVGDAV